MSSGTLASQKPSASSMWSAGQVIAGRFELVQELGRGGMGAVWEAKHQTLGSSVAIKLIEPDTAESTMGVVRFVREAKASAALRSPHVVQTLDHGIDNGTPYIVMELLEGENLDERLQRVGRLSNLELARVITHVARALTKAADQRIIHRDLKPANIFIVQNDDEEVVKVLDFGIAKQNVAAQEQVSGETKTGTLIGTPQYMSPEQARGKKLDWRSDLWSLAIIAYECHVGQRPFTGPALGELILQICMGEQPVPSEHAEVSEGFDAWFAKGAALDPDDRFQSAKEVAQALRRVVLREGAVDPGELDDSVRRRAPALTTEPELATKTDLGSTIGESRKSSRLGWGVAAAAVIGIAGFAYSSASSEPTAPEPVASPSPSSEPSAKQKPNEVSVRIEPAGVNVRVHGERMDLDEGVLVLKGPLGSVHEVELTSGEMREVHNVIITEVGASPSLLSLALPPAASDQAPQPPPRPAGARAKPLPVAAAPPPPREASPSAAPAPPPSPTPEPKPATPAFKGTFE
jgi:eukaryotic-like serine/threonine-protein kinase